MKEILTAFYWVPFAWILLQAYLFISMGLFLMRWKKMIVAPVAGMDYGAVLVAGSLLTGILVIVTGTIGALFQSAKTLQYNGGAVLHNMLLKFTEFFLLGTIATALYFITAMINQRFFFRRSEDPAAHEGNLPWGILVAFLNTGIAIVFWFWVNQLAVSITPAFVNIR